jgi:hypothetical protein
MMLFSLISDGKQKVPYISIAMHSPQQFLDFLFKQYPCVPVSGMKYSLWYDDRKDGLVWSYNFGYKPLGCLDVITISFAQYDLTYHELLLILSSFRQTARARFWISP